MPITGSGSGGGATALDDLSDVVITAPTNCNILHYDGAIWENLDSTSDWLSNYLYLPGRTNGQVLGANAHAGGSLFSFCIEKQILIDEVGVNSFTPGIALAVYSYPVNGIPILQQNAVMTSLSGVASGTLSMFQMGNIGNPAYSSGSYVLQGFLFNIPSLGNPAGVTLNVNVIRTLFGLLTNSGNVGTVRGLYQTITGSATVGQSTATKFVGIQLDLNNSRTPVTTYRGIEIGPTAAPLAAVTAFAGIELLNIFNDADVVDWSGLRLPDITLPTGNKWALDLFGTTIKSKIAGPTAIGWNPATNATITSKLHLAAGTAAANTSPLKFQTGVNLTAAESGAMEFDGTELYITDSVPTRQTIELKKNKGVANGYASLGANGLVPESQLPPPRLSRIFAMMGA